jgi:hypothetical protein
MDRLAVACMCILQIYQDDILYANSHPAVQAMLVEASKRF